MTLALDPELTVMVLLSDPYPMHLGQVHVIFRTSANDLGEPSPSKKMSFYPSSNKTLKVKYRCFYDK